MNIIKDMKQKNIFVFAILLIIPFLIILPQCVNNTFFLGYDGITYFSTRKFYLESLFQGDLTFWNKYLMGGSPSEVWGGILYPPFVILGWLPMKWFVVTYYCFHLGFGAIFFFLYLCEIKCARRVSVAVAILYECSIHLGGLRKDHMGIITCLVWVPFILYFSHKYINECKFKWLIVVAAGMSMQVLAGVFQQALYTDIAVFFYICILAIKKGNKPQKIIKSVVMWIICYIGFSSVNLIPTIALMKEYSTSGAVENTFQNFKSYSINFYKLLQMVFPNIFGDVYSACGAENSSGLDIELYLGVGVFILIAFTIIHYRKQVMVKTSCWMMLISFLYAAIAHIPGLRYVIYNIPVIGSFRVPSRSLFIFILFSYVLLAIGLTNIINNGELSYFYEKLRKAFRVGLIILVIFSLMVILECNFSKNYSVNECLEWLIKVFSMPVIVSTIMLIVVFILVNKQSIKENVEEYVLLGFILSLTIVETYPFTTTSNVSRGDIFVISDNQSKYLKDNIENFKVLDICIDPWNPSSVVAKNVNVNKRIAAINAYVPFNNPGLYRILNNGQCGMLNDSGKFIVMANADTNLKSENDILSMLGIKYLIDSSGKLENDNTFINRNSFGEVIFDEELIIIPSSKDYFSVYSNEASIKPNTCYRITFTAMTCGNDEILYVDLYGSGGYDNVTQEAMLTVDDIESNCYVVFNSGDTSAAMQPIQIRFIAMAESDIIIKSIKIEELSNVSGEYKLFINETDSTLIYENPNANDILFVPEGVQQVADSETFFREYLNYDLDDIAYVEEELNYSINQKDFEISDINFTNNQITAHITAKSNGFIMFSQCYYPGWRVYVNGERTNLYKVSETIMGAELPAGEYDIQFVYVPIYLIIGAVITAITCMFSLIYIIVSNRKDKKDRGEGNVG